ncbi:hypothetical protein [Allocoleopsis franciscana]|uniref:hypothetical protein n=1 Tax=Allocoleopsis franciscana TaxID=2886352 RepID=UPI0002DD20D4|nr:hypothetical protein [Allocoleopsis franciscana]
MALPHPLFVITKVQFVHAWQARFISMLEINIEAIVRIKINIHKDEWIEIEIENPRFCVGWVEQRKTQRNPIYC